MNIDVTTVDKISWRHRILLHRIWRH